MSDYKDLKNELEEISVVVNKFPEELKPKVFDLLISKYYGGSINIDSEVRKPSAKNNTKPDIDNQDQEISSNTVTSTSNTDYLSIDDFIKKCKNFKSSLKRNLIVIYYYEVIAKSGATSENEILDVYKKMGWKPPKNFQQSIIDTRGKNKWIYSEENDDEERKWLTTRKGYNFVKDEILSE